MNQKGFAPIILIIAVVVLLVTIGGVYLFASLGKNGKEEEVSPENTLRKIMDKGETISCEMPKDWFERSVDRGFMISPQLPIMMKSAFTPAITIHFYDPKDGFASAENYISYLLSQKQAKQIGITQKMKVAGEISTRIITEEKLPPIEDPGGPGEITIRQAYAITPWNKGFWVFRYSTAREDYDKYSDFFDHLLKSCQVKNETSPTPSVAVIDFRDVQLIYSTNNGSLPSPDHRESMLTIFESAEGLIAGKQEIRDYNKVLENKSFATPASEKQFEELINLALDLKSSPDASKGCPGSSTQSVKVMKVDKTLFEISADSCDGNSTYQSLSEFFGKVTQELQLIERGGKLNFF